MKDWLEKQKEQEQDVLDVVKIQSKQIVEDLIPQIRLCALENDMEAHVNLKLHFQFTRENTEIWSEGHVDFPAKSTTSQCFTIDYAEQTEEEEEEES